MRNGFWEVVRRAARRGSSFAGAATLVAVACAPPARADLCSDCAKPTEEAVSEASGVEFGDLIRYSVTGGDCTTEMTGKPVRRTGAKIPVWSAHGEAYTCPTGKLTAHVSYSVGKDQRFDWSWSATAGLELTAALVAKAKAEITMMQGGSSGTSELGTIDQEIEAAYCLRNEYWAVFFATEAEVELEFAVRRTWTWTIWLWLVTGPSPRDSGEVVTACGTGTVKGDRLEPLFFSLGVAVRGCRDAQSCAGIAPAEPWQGWFPPLPPGYDPFGPLGPFAGQPDPSSAEGSDSEPTPASGEGDGSGDGESEGSDPDAPITPDDPAPAPGPVPSEPDEPLPEEPLPEEPLPDEPLPEEPLPEEPLPDEPPPEDDEPHYGEPLSVLDPAVGAGEAPSGARS